MKTKHTILGTALLLALSASGQAMAAQSSLSGWGKAFAEAHGQTQSIQGSAQGQAQGSAMLNFNGQATKSVESQVQGMAKGTVDAGVSSMVGTTQQVVATAEGTLKAATGVVDAVYSTVGNTAESVLGAGLNTGLGLVGKATSGLNLQVEGTTAQNLAVGNVLGANLSANALTQVQVAALPAVAATANLTAGLVQNIVASRPASLMGLLR